MASSQVEFASSSTSPFSCINTRNRHHHHRAPQAKHFFNHFAKDQLNNDNNSHISWDTKNNLGTLRFASNKRDQDESSLSSSSPNREEPSPSSFSSSSSPSSLLSPPLRKQKPSPIPVPSDFSPCDISNLGASSLVQIWEKRLTQSSSNTTTSKSSSTPKSSPNASSSPQSSSDDSSPQGQIHNEGDHYQSERSVHRVADIIKRLTLTTTTTSSEEINVDNNNNQSHQDQQNYGMGSPEQLLIENNRSFVINSPRIRGRQAFNDLLMQMERDRHRELNNLADRAAVSKFSHRGRIQSLLRLRLMQHGMVAKDERRLPSTTSQEIKQLPQGSVIMRLRERFSTRVTNGSAVEAEVAETTTPCREKENIVTPPPLYINPPNPTQNSLSHADQNKEEEEEKEASPCSDVSVPSSEAQNAETSSPMVDLNAESEVLENVEVREEKHDDVADQLISSGEVEEEEEEEEEGSEDEYGERIYDKIEEIETSEANFDWISQISKPKSYWEDLRQAWYKEMLDHESQNYDICQLLQRKTVSNVLGSDFRERMDRLMESHLQGTQTIFLASRDDDDEVNHHGKMEKLIAFLQQRLNPAKSDQEKEIKEEEKHEEEEEEEILISDSYNGESDSMNQSSPSQCRDNFNEDGDDSEFRSVSASLRQPSQSPSFFQYARQNSSPRNPPSIEMELIYDLRGHMKQLCQEMSELRKSIRSCMDMQMSLQKSLDRENHTAKGKKSHERVLKKGHCCICSKLKADSLLYRCGHMCTCLKCANELQWKNGKCPICEAPIVDIVRVFVDA